MTELSPLPTPEEPDEALDDADAMERRLRWIGATRYHSLHPFHRLLHGVRLSQVQVQAWALNRYHYQSSIPLKDAVVLSRFRDRAMRLEWRHRIEDHDGSAGSERGIERSLKLTDGLGLDRPYVESTTGILAATTSFQRRLNQAPRDAGFAIDYVRASARITAKRQAVCDALTFKTNCLLVQLDALHQAYVTGMDPAGAFRPEDA